MRASAPVGRSGTRPLSKQRLRLWIRLLRATRALEAEIRARLREHHGVTLPQFDVMATLARTDKGMSMTELSRKLMVSNGNVTGIVERLVRDKLVLREAPAEDRRSFIVRLTPKGLARFSVLAAAHEEWVNALLSDFGADDSSHMIGRFDGLAERIRQGAGRP